MAEEKKPKEKKPKKEHIKKEKPENKEKQVKLEQQKIEKEKQRLLKEYERKQHFADTIAEHISIGTRNAERYDAHKNRCLLISILGVVVVIGGTFGTIYFSLDFIPTFITSVITFIGACGIATGAILFLKEFGSDWGLMLTQSSYHRFQTPLYYSDFKVVNPETKDPEGTYQCVEKAYMFPEINKVVLRMINTNPDEFMDPDNKKKYIAVQLPLEGMFYEFNGQMEIKTLTKPRLNEITTTEAEDPDEPEDFDGDAGVTDDEYEQTK